VFHFYFDLFIICALLLTFSPRKWPEYFSIGIVDLDVMSSSYRLINDDNVV